VVDISSEVEWSPADNPYAIAVSQSTWWFAAVRLAAARLDGPRDPNALPVSSIQLDARSLVIALAQLPRALRLEEGALRAEGVGRETRKELAQAGRSFERALPDLGSMRDALIHFDEWAVGRGGGLQGSARAAGKKQREVAASYWSFGYRPDDGAIRFGPFSLHVASAVNGARALHEAICKAAVEVDRVRSTRESSAPDVGRMDAQTHENHDPSSEHH
jgi:hypothetical protein